MVEGKPQFPRHEFFAELPHDLPIFRSDRLDAWMVSRYDDVKNVLSSDSQFQPPQGGASASAYDRSFLQMSPIPELALWHIVAPAFHLLKHAALFEEG